MKIIEKFGLIADKDHRYIITAPEELQILGVGFQSGGLSLWALVNNKTFDRQHIFYILNVGAILPKEDLKYVGSFTEVVGNDFSKRLEFMKHVFYDITS